MHQTGPLDHRGPCTVVRTGASRPSHIGSHGSPLAGQRNHGTFDQAQGQWTPGGVWIRRCPREPYTTPPSNSFTRRCPLESSLLDSRLSERGAACHGMSLFRLTQLRDHYRIRPNPVSAVECLHPGVNEFNRMLEKARPSHLNHLHSPAP